MSVLFLLQKQLKTVHEDSLQEKKKKAKQMKSDCLERLLRLTSVWVNYRNGVVLIQPDSLALVS